VTNAIDRLVAGGLVDRTPDVQDRRRVFASLTPEGKRVLKRATRSLLEIDFGLTALNAQDREKLFDVLRLVRASDFEA
jgi:DNA-binding MarR family transcriptional regulator